MFSICCLRWRHWLRPCLRIRYWCKEIGLESQTFSWWRHRMETFSALLGLCVGNSLVTGEFPSQRPVMWNFRVFFALRPNKRLSKQSRRRRFEMPLRSLQRYRNVLTEWGQSKWRNITAPPWWTLCHEVSRDFACHFEWHPLISHFRFKIFNYTRPDRHFKAYASTARTWVWIWKTMSFATLPYEVYNSL